MSDTFILKVGRRGEIYTNREVRRRTGITPGGKVVARIENNMLIIKPKPSAISLLDKPRVNEKPITLESLLKIRREISEEIESR